MMMGEGMKQVLAKPIQLADQVIKMAGESHTNRQECLELKSRAERLVALLRQAARAELYERPARRIMDDTGHVLDKAFGVVEKSRSHGLINRLFAIVPAATFVKMFTQLDNSITDMSWLLRVSSPSADPDDEDQLHGLPPIAQNEPILFFIWENIATLYKGSLDARCESAGALVSLARDNSHYANLIIEEDGVGPLLRLLKDGRLEGQENAARALGLLGRDPESVDHLVNAGVCSAFAKVLKDGDMKVQAVVAWAVAELAANNAQCQDVFAQNNVVRLLIHHLAFETIQEHSKYSVPSKAASLHSIVLAKKANAATASSAFVTAAPHFDDLDQSPVPHPLAPGTSKTSQSRQDQFHSIVQSAMPTAKIFKDMNQSGATVPNGGLPSWKPRQQSLNGSSHKARELEDPATKANMKAMAAKALQYLAKGNLSVCKSITESKALLCFAFLLEKGVGDIQSNSAMALMEIARVAEEYPELRHSAFKPNSPAAKAVVDNMLLIVEKGEYDELLIPSITALGCLSRTFRASENRMIGPLVRLLDEREAAVSREAAIALTKFACTDNYLHLGHSKAIIDAGGARHLVSLVYFGEQVQIEALILMCYLAKHVPESEELSNAGVFSALLWASKQGHMVQDPTVDSLLPEAKARMELYQPKST